jgi:hypothetical protein
MSQNLTWLNLPNLPLPVKVLFCGYLLAVGLGLCMAGLQIMLTHGMADGKPGLSLNDIVYSYYGNRGGSKLESKLVGSMKEMGTPQVRLEIIKWVHSGSTEQEWNSRLKNIFAQHCVSCHSAIPNIPDFSKYEEVKKLAIVDDGANIKSLTRVSHIHLFGISFIFFFMGLIFSFAIGVPRWLKILAIAFPFGFLILDVLSWWLTKWNPNFAWLTIVGGFGYSIASAVMWFISMHQILILSRNGKTYGNSWENDLR